MAMCDEFPSYYFEDSNGDYPWDKPGWGEEPSDSEEVASPVVEEHKGHFESYEEAKQYAIKNPGSTFVRNKNGSGFVLKGSLYSESALRWQKQDAMKREENVKSGKPVNNGIGWKDKEIAILISLNMKCEDIITISQKLERTVLSISAKLRSLELISEDEHKENLDKYLSNR